MVTVAVVTFIVWGLVGPEPRMAHALINAVAVLIIVMAVYLIVSLATSVLMNFYNRTVQIHER